MFLFTVRLLFTAGEPYDSPDTAWLRPSDVFPLAGPHSPLTFALLCAFDDIPSAATAALEETADSPAGGGNGGGGGGGGEFDSPGGPGSPRGFSLHASRRGSGGGRSWVFRQQLPSMNQLPVSGSYSSMPHRRRGIHPRAGGHALFAAWIASTSAGKFFDRQTCRGLCFRSSWSVRVAAVERMVTQLVLLPYMRGLPDSSAHPFLTAVVQRQGVWQPPLQEEEEEASLSSEVTGDLEDVSGGGSGGKVTQPSFPGGTPHTEASSKKVREERTNVAKKRSSDGENAARQMYLSGGFDLGVAEMFMDDPALAGLTALMEEMATSSGSGGAVPWGGPLTPQQEDEEVEVVPGDGNGSGSRTPVSRSRGEQDDVDGGKSGAASGRKVGKCFGGGEPYGSTAALWDILRRPEYEKRAWAFFRHLWMELGRKGLEHPLLLMQPQQ